MAATTTRQFKAEIAEQARMKAEEIISREIGAPATAVKAVKGVTTKAERATIARYPAEQPWMVTLEYDLMAAAEVLKAQIEAPKTCQTCGLEYTGSIVDHAESQAHRDVSLANGLSAGDRLAPATEIAAAKDRVAQALRQAQVDRLAAELDAVSAPAEPGDLLAKAAALAGEDCGADYCVDPGNCAKHDETQHLNRDGRQITLCGKPFAQVAGAVYDHREGFAPTGARCDECADEADALQNGRPTLDVATTMRLAKPGERYAFVARLGTKFEATIDGSHEFAGEVFVTVKDSTVAIRHELRASFTAGTYRMPAVRIASMTLVEAPPPASPRERSRARAIELAERAVQILRGEIAAGYEFGLEREGLDPALGAEQLLREAANAAHWTAVVMGPAIRTATIGKAALSGATGRREPFVGSHAVIVGPELDNPDWPSERDIDARDDLRGGRDLATEGENRELFGK